MTKIIKEQISYEMDGVQYSSRALAESVLIDRFGEYIDGKLNECGLAEFRFKKQTLQFVESLWKDRASLLSLIDFEIEEMSPLDLPDHLQEDN